MLELSLVQQIAVWILPVLFAITLHEASHAWVAYRLGDPTAKQLGRVSFNPINHIDPFGTVILPIMILLVSNFQFVLGWAKPVPINPANFVKPRHYLALATAAGPISNLLMALIWGLIFKLGIILYPGNSLIGVFLILTGQAGVFINLLLAFFNLLPIPPLDGSKVLMSFLPLKQALIFQKIEPFGFIILLVLLLTGILNKLISPLMGLSSIFLKWLYLL